MITSILENADIATGAAMRDYMDRLPAREVKRLRAMLDLGLENVDIASEMALNRSAVMYHRRLYDAELVAAGRPPTEPLRIGRIAGRALPPSLAARLRAILLKGIPSDRAALALEVSRPCAVRYRAAIVKELAAKGRTLPGCDITGALIGRRSPNALPPTIIAEIERRLKVPERIPAIATATGVSTPTVRRIWRDLKTTLTTAPICPCGKPAHHAQRCTPSEMLDPRANGPTLRALIEAAVPRHHDAALRADMMQDVTAQIMALPRAPVDLSALVRKTVASNYKRFANRWGDLSLDAPIGTDGEGTLLDVLAARSTDDG